MRRTRSTSQLKNVTNPELRKEALAGLYAVAPGIFSQKKVLLFDDLFRSGATMNEITSWRFRNSSGLAKG